MNARRILRFLPLSISLGFFLVLFGQPTAATELTFPLTTVGHTTAVSYTYTLLESSETEVSVSISSPCVPFGFAGLEAQEFVLAPGDAVTFDVTFSPPSAATYACSFVISAVGGIPETVHETWVALSGTGVGDDSEGGPEGPTIPWFEFPWWLLVPTDPSATGQGTTDEAGRFEVKLPPSTTVSGRLSVCGGGALGDVEVIVARWEGGYGVATPGYEAAIVQPIFRFSLFGIEAVDLGDVCVEPHPAPPRPAEILLLSPESGEGPESGWTTGPLCWESVGDPSITYTVFSHSKTCDPEVVGGPHPFAPLIPDSGSRRRASELRRQRAVLERQIELQRTYCEDIASMFDQMVAAREAIPGHLDHLRRQAAEASAAETGGMDLPLPTTCPRDPLDLLAPHAAVLDALQIRPCQPDPCRGLAEALSSLVSALGSLSASAWVSSFMADVLVDHWVGWAGYRGTMSLYHSLFSWADAVIGLVFDLMDALTPDIESIIQGIVEEYLTEATCQRFPDLCGQLEAAQTARDQLNAIRSIMQSAKATGTPGPLFLLQMVRAMVQQVAAVTAGEAWEEYAQDMAAHLWDAYEQYLCLQRAYEWLIDREDQIKRMCDECLDCLRTKLEDVDAELAAVEGEQQTAAAARVAYWQEQLGVIAGQIGRVGEFLDDAWYDACCSTHPTTISVPGSSLCAQQLEGALKTALGDKACFLTFVCTLECEVSAEGEVIEASVKCTFERPLPERRFCCCVPDERSKTPIGQASDPGRPGEPVCFPGGPVPPDSEGWSVEGRDPEGRLIASSGRRPWGPGARTEPSRIPPDPAPSCDCSVGLSLDGVAITGGGPALLVRSGVPARVQVSGDCGPSCVGDGESITIIPPAMAPAGPAFPWLLPLPPVHAAGSILGYDFPIPGTYTILAEWTCEDGQRCSATAEIFAVTSPTGPVPRHPDDPYASIACPACGSDLCLAISYRRSDETPFFLLQGHRLSVETDVILEWMASSVCASECPGDRHVRWELTFPDGTLDVSDGMNLYQMAYWFDQTGPYRFCLIETVPCEMGDRVFETWWIVTVEGVDAP